MDGPVSTHLRSNVIGYLALFVALSGTAVAASDGDRGGKVLARDIHTGAVTSEAIRRNNVEGIDIKTRTIETDDIASGAITGEQVADNSLTGQQIDESSLELSGATGGAGGDLTGNYPNPVIAGGAIESTDLFAPALRDGAAGTPTLRSLGTGAGQAAAGNDPRLSDARTPTGSAGGDLTGSYPNPVIGADAITSAEVANGSLRRVADLAVFASGFTASATVGAHSCGLLGADFTGIFDVQAGDIVEVYPPVDGTVNTNVIWQNSTTQDGDEIVLIPICNPTPSSQTVNSGLPFGIYRP